MAISNTHYGHVFIRDLIEKSESVFFIGIGGINMSSLAHITFKSGKRVGGSDRTKTALTEKLEKVGIDVKYSHASENVENYDVVVYTVAISADNAELVRAKEKGLVCISRADYLGYLMMNYDIRIGVSGTHGKSSTTSMIAHTLINGKKDPTVLSGAELKIMDGAYRVGEGDSFVFEACEYMDSFLDFEPNVAVVLNIEHDHVDYFKTFDQMIDSFVKYMDKTSPSGTVIANFDDEVLKKACERVVGSKIISYGVKNKSAEFTAYNIRFPGGFGEFDVLRSGEFFCHIKLQVSGQHNVSNALAAIAAAHLSGLSAQEISKSLSGFCGVGRRMEFKGKCCGADVFDDYGHHPTEIDTTLAGVSKMGYERVWCVFQPHTYSRVAELMEDFSKSFDCADQIIIADIYAAREENVYGITGRDLAIRIGRRATYIHTMEEIAQHLKESITDGDVLIVMGAGDIYKLFPLLELTKKSS